MELKINSSNPKELIHAYPLPPPFREKWQDSQLCNIIYSMMVTVTYKTELCCLMRTETLTTNKIRMRIKLQVSDSIVQIQIRNPIADHVGSLLRT